MEKCRKGERVIVNVHRSVMENGGEIVMFITSAVVGLHELGGRSVPGGEYYWKTDTVELMAPS